MIRDFSIISFSESTKGSDSEDDFLRQKSKTKVASDSDSDSDIGTKKGEILKDSFLQSTSRSAIIASTCDALGEFLLHLFISLLS